MSRIQILFVLLSLISLKNIATPFELKRDTLVADNFFNRAESLRSIANYDSASIYYKRAAQEYKDDKIWDKYLLATYYRGGLLQSKSDKYKEAIDWLLGNLSQVPEQDSSRAVMSKKADIYIRVAYAYRSLGKYHEAIDYFDRALAFMKYAKKDKTEAVLTGKAVTFWRLGNNENALIQQENALKILQNNKNSNPQRLIIANNVLGLIHVSLGNYHKGDEYYKKCLRLLLIPENSNMSLMAIVYNNLGTVHGKTGNSQKAIEYYNRALHVFKESKSNKSNIASVLNDVGKAYIELEKYDEAIIFFNQSLEISLEIFKSDHHYIARSYFHLAEIYNLSGKFDLARTYYEKALVMRLNMLGEHSHYVAYTYNRLANLLEKQGLYEEALENLDKSIASNSKKSNEDQMKLSTSELFHNSLSKLEFFFTLDQKASVLQSIYKKDRKVTHLLSALQIYELCDSFIDTIRTSYQTYSDKVELNKSSTIFFAEAMDLCWQLFERSKEVKYIQYLFYFSERSKGAVLNASMTDTRSKKFANIPDSLLVKERELKIDLSFYKSQEQRELVKKEERDTAKLNYAQEEIFNLSREQEDLIQVLENNYPKYYAYKHNIKIASLEEVQNKIIKQNQSMLEYFVGDSLIYTVTITNDNSYIHQQPKPTSFDSIISTFQKAITNKDFETYAHSANILYNILIAPVKDNIQGNRLIIIPDGTLWHVNFDLLLSSNKPTENYKELDYLLKYYAISYAYSANLLFQESNRKEPLNNKQPLLAFSFSNSDNNESSNNIALTTLRSSSSEDLPGSRAEVRAIANIFDGQYYYGQSANEANFKTNAEDYAILHLALHGEIDDVYPNNSKLYFTQNNDSIEDGYLYAYELYNMSLNAELAVLSACNTGSGKLVKGEGIISLGRAFTYAGCKSLVLTQWEVPDATTPQIMKDFYQGLKEGLTKDEALRQTKLNHLATADKLTASPFYWGSFVLLGDSSAIDLEEDNNSTLYSTFILLLIIVVLIFIRNKRLKVTA